MISRGAQVIYLLLHVSYLCTYAIDVHCMLYVLLRICMYLLICLLTLSLLKWMCNNAWEDWLNRKRGGRRPNQRQGKILREEAYRPVRTTTAGLWDRYQDCICTGFFKL